MARLAPPLILVEMSPVHPPKRIRPRLGALQVLFLAATAAGLAVIVPSQAQETTGLRGGQAVDASEAELLLQQDAQPRQAAYTPVSQGAVPDDADQATSDPFAEGASGGIAETEAAAEPAARAAATAEDSALTATRREPAVDSQDNQPLDPDAERVQAIEGLNRPVEENPYEPVGIRWGSFILKPSIESGITATSNADSSADGSSAVLSETTLRLNAESDWSSNRASIDAYGTFREGLSGQEVNDFSAGIDAEMEVELGKEYRAKTTFTYSAAPESAASPVVIPDTVDEPVRQTIGGTLGLEKDLGKARFGITGGISHDSYGDADLESGGVLSQKDRDATLYTLTLRTGYEISPALTPFVETEIGRNLYDQEVDSAGYRRSSDQYAVRGGLELDMGEKLSGEFSAGWISEDFDDPRLKSLSTPTIAADLRWSPQRGTDITLNGSTALEGTTTSGESGSVLYSAGMDIERQIRANLTGNAGIGVAYRNYAESDGYDVIFDAEASLTWWLNRYAGVVGRVRHETVSSNLPGRDSETNSVFLGLKLQR